MRALNLKGTHLLGAEKRATHVWRRLLRRMGLKVWGEVEISWSPTIKREGHLSFCHPLTHPGTGGEAVQHRDRLVFDEIRPCAEGIRGGAPRKRGAGRDGAAGPAHAGAILLRQDPQLPNGPTPLQLCLGFGCQ